MDNIPGTAGDDTIIAGSQAGLATLNAGDTIKGGGGNDTLKIYNEAGALSAANFGTASIAEVENVEVTFSATAETLNVSTNSDVTNATIVGGFDGVVTAKLAQAAGLTGTIDTTTAAATFTFVDNAGGADTATLNVNNAALLNAAGAGNGVTIAGVETLNIAATGTNVLGALTAAATKMVITGAGSVSTTLAGTATKTIDGSAATGNLTIDNKAAAADVESIKTGTGNDTYTTQYLNLTKDDVIDLGEGTDSLRFSDAATFNTAATKELLTKVTGVEQLGTVNALLTVDGDFVSQTSYYTDGAAGDMALTNIANNADVNFGAGAILASTVGMKLGSNTLNVNLKGSATAASDLTLGLAVTGSATINVNSAGTDGQPNNVLALTAADNQSVVVTGSQNLTLTATNAGTVTGFSIDGSAFTGKLTVTGTGSADTVKGGSGDDVISGGAGAIADTLTGGAGADKFIIIAGNTASTADVVTDFVTKTDKIDFNAAGTGAALAAAGDFTKATAAVADFTAALAAANLVLTDATGTMQVNVQQVGSDSYAFFNDGALAGADQVVKLTGVALTGIEFGDVLA